MVYPRCSFCGEQPVVAWFEGPNFTERVDTAEKVRAESAWLACSTCLRLVDAGDREGLVDRAVNRLIRRHPERDHARSEFEALQRRHLEEQFWAPRDR